MQGKTYSIVVLVHVKRYRSTHIDYDFDRRLLSVRERDSFKMRHNTVGIMDDQSFFLCGTELGRLDVER